MEYQEYDLLNVTVTRTLPIGLFVQLPRGGTGFVDAQSIRGLGEVIPTVDEMPQPGADLQAVVTVPDLNGQVRLSVCDRDVDDARRLHDL